MRIGIQLEEVEQGQEITNLITLIKVLTGLNSKDVWKHLFL